MLSNEHLAMLRQGSGISDDVIRARGYRTVTDRRDLEELGFSSVQLNVPTLVIPIYSVDGKLVTHQLRPDSPRLGERGKPIKYENRKGSRLAVDVPPSVRENLDDPKVDLWITEGTKKADSAASHGLCCIGLMGVHGYSGTNAKGGKCELSDWRQIALNGRCIYVAFDSDVTSKQQVAKALEGLITMLIRKGASVKIVSIPSKSGEKVGLDDWLVGGGSISDLVKSSSEYDEHSSGNSKHGFNFQHWTKLEEECSNQQWLVQDLLVAGGSSLVAAQPKVGKTTLLLWLARCVALGQPFLGKETLKGPVILVLLEGSAAMYWDALHAMNLPEDAPLMIHTGTAPAEAAQRLREAIDALDEPPVLIIVDTLFKLIKVQEGNEYGIMVSAIEQLTELASEVGAHICLSHHASKMNFDSGVGIRALGSTAIAGGVDTILVLLRKGDRRTIQSEARWGEELRPTILDFDPMSRKVSLGHMNERRVASNVEEKIIAALTGQTLTKAELKKHVKNNRLSDGLRKLVEENRVVFSGAGVRGNPKRYSIRQLGEECPEHDSGFKVLPLYTENPENQIIQETQYVF